MLTTPNKVEKILTVLTELPGESVATNTAADRVLVDDYMT